MKVVIWILACVVLVGCESRPLDTQRLDSSGDDVSRELATAVRRALAAKTLEDNRLAQYAVEKQRLVSRLMPNGNLLTVIRWRSRATSANAIRKQRRT